MFVATGGASCTGALHLNSKGYHSLVPGLISIFFETVWVPLNYYYYLCQNIVIPDG